MGKKKLGFRAWFYLRMGYTIYWAFLIMGINTLTVTYYLAIENVPILQVIFPTFAHYIIITLVIGVPLLISTGYAHYRIIPGYKAEAEVGTTSNPYLYKLPPGYWLGVIMPYFRLQSDLLLKLTENKPLNEEEIQKMQELQNQMDHLIKGGYVGPKDRIERFKSQD